jgi:hypothetical protein
MNCCFYKNHTFYVLSALWLVGVNRFKLLGVLGLSTVIYLILFSDTAVLTAIQHCYNMLFKQKKTVASFKIDPATKKYIVSY